jgi:transcriptional regulator with XRE-family HTH domain
MSRPLRKIPPDASAELAAFALGLRALRDNAELTLRDLSGKVHFSIGALSEATGGKKLPSREITAAYVQACGGNVSEWLARWNRLHNDAKAQRLTPLSQPSGTTGPDRPASAPGRIAWQISKPSSVQATVTTTTTRPRRLFSSREERGVTSGVMPTVAARAGRRLFPNREESAETPTTLKVTTTVANMPAMTELVIAAAKSVARAEQTGHRIGTPNLLQPDPVLGALSLCTTPLDFMGMLRETYKKSGRTLDTISRRCTRLGWVVGKSTLSSMLRNSRLPDTHQLHAFLLACDVSAEQIEPWHYHLTRLKIAEMRNRNHPRPEARACYSQQSLLGKVRDTMINYYRVPGWFVAAALLIALLIQLQLKF